MQRGLIGDVISRFEKKGFKLVAMKLVHATKELLEQHYADLSTKKFFPGLIAYMSSGPVCAMVWEGAGAVATGRVMLGATKPSDSAPVRAAVIAYYRDDSVYDEGARDYLSSAVPQAGWCSCACSER